MRCAGSPTGNLMTRSMPSRMLNELAFGSTFTLANVRSRRLRADALTPRPQEKSLPAQPSKGPARARSLHLRNMRFCVRAAPFITYDTLGRRTWLMSFDRPRQPDEPRQSAPGTTQGQGLRLRLRLPAPAMDEQDPRRLQDRMAAAEDRRHPGLRQRAGLARLAGERSRPDRDRSRPRRSASSVQGKVHEAARSKPASGAAPP